MPGFPDKFVPFMDEPPGAFMSTAAVNVYGRTVRSLRQFTLASMNREPERPAAHPQPAEPIRDTDKT
jgi:hydrogenase small subunit